MPGLREGAVSFVFDKYLKAQSLTGSAKHVVGFEAESYVILYYEGLMESLTWDGQSLPQQRYPFQLVSPNFLPMWQNYAFLRKKNDPLRHTRL